MLCARHSILIATVSLALLAEFALWGTRAAAQPAAPSAPPATASPPPPGRSAQAQPQSAPSSANRSQGAARSPRASAPYMIGDFFGGIGACGDQPVFVGRSIFHSVNTPFGDDDFHLISDGNPATFVGGIGTGNGAAFVGPSDNLVGFGRPGQTFVAVPTGEFVDVNDPAATGQFNNQQVFNLFTSTATDVCVPSPGTSSVGRVKLAENASPLPRDRVFLNYSYFDNVPLQAGGVGVNRFVPGFEKTLLGGMTSIEVRAPFASTMSSDLVTGGKTDTGHAEFGNLTLISKTLLWQNDVLSISGGIQVTLPTADDITLSTPLGTRLVEVQNEAVHLMPFVGALYTPNERYFFQSFLQIDTAANGNPVAIRDPFTSRLMDAGDLHDTDFLYLDMSWGYWLYRNNCPCARVTGLAPIFEMHYNASLGDADSVVQSGLRAGYSANDIDLVNLVVGLVVECGSDTTLTTAFATPVAGGQDRDFDGELRVIFNRRFGPSSRAARAQF